MPKPKQKTKAIRHRTLVGNSLILNDLEGNARAIIDATCIPNGVMMSLHGPDRFSIQVSASEDGVGASLIRENGRSGAGIAVRPALGGAGFSLYDEEGRPRVSINGENDHWVIEYTHYGAGKKTVTRLPLELLADLVRKVESRDG